MKKLFLILVAVVFVLSLASFSFAEDMQQQDMMEEGGQGMEMGMDGQHQSCGQHGHKMMMGMMNKPTMLATADGGVLVLDGPHLVKYDQDLNLVKEVELKKPKPPTQHKEHHTDDVDAAGDDDTATVTS